MEDIVEGLRALLRLLQSRYVGFKSEWNFVLNRNRVDIRRDEAFELTRKGYPLRDALSIVTLQNLRFQGVLPFQLGVFESRKCRVLQVLSNKQSGTR